MTAATSAQCKKSIQHELDGQFRIHAKWLPEISPKHKRWLSIAFIMAVLAESSFLLIQNIKVYQTKSAKDLSLSSAIVLLVTNIIWILMALLVLKDYAVLLSGILYVIFSTMLIINIGHVYLSAGRAAALRYILHMFAQRGYERKHQIVYYEPKQLLEVFTKDCDGNNVLAILTGNEKSFGDNLGIEKVAIDKLVTATTNSDCQEDEDEEVDHHHIFQGEDKKNAKDTGVGFIDIIVEFCEKHAIKTVVLITDKLSPPAIKAINAIQSIHITRLTYTIASVGVSENHMFFPQIHRALSEDEYQQFLSSRPIESLCKLSRHDPFVAYFGYRPKQILEVIEKGKSYYHIEDE